MPSPSVEENAYRTPRVGFNYFVNLSDRLTKWLNSTASVIAALRLLELLEITNNGQDVSESCKSATVPTMDAGEGLAGVRETRKSAFRPCGSLEAWEMHD